MKDTNYTSEENNYDHFKLSSATPYAASGNSSMAQTEGEIIRMMSKVTRFAETQPDRLPDRIKSILPKIKSIQSSFLKLHLGSQLKISTAAISKIETEDVDLSSLLRQTVEIFIEVPNEILYQTSKPNAFDFQQNVANQQDKTTAFAFQSSGDGFGCITAFYFLPLANCGNSTSCKGGDHRRNFTTSPIELLQLGNIDVHIHICPVADISNRKFTSKLEKLYPKNWGPLPRSRIIDQHAFTATISDDRLEWLLKEFSDSELSLQLEVAWQAELLLYKLDAILNLISWSYKTLLAQSDCMQHPMPAK